MPNNEHYEVDRPETKELLRDIGARIKQVLPDSMGFTLFMFDYGQGGAMFYISSAERGDMVQSLQEFLAKQGVENMGPLKTYKAGEQLRPGDLIVIKPNGLAFKAK